MRALLDIKMLLALSDTSHPLHQRAQLLRQRELPAHGWASCPLTQNGFVRISTQRRYTTPKTKAEALAILQRLVIRPDHEFWPDDLSLLDVAHVDHSRLLGPKQITDVYLLALAVKHGGRFVTLDSGISYRAARGGRTEHLVIV